MDLKKKLINLKVEKNIKTIKKNFSGVNYTSYFFKDEMYDENLLRKLKEADYILVSIPPIHGVDQVIKNFYQFIKPR